MFYVCEQRGDLYGVADTDDGVCEFYSKEELLKLARKIGILGVSIRSDSVSVVGIGTVLAKLKILGGSSEEVVFKIALNNLDEYEIVSLKNKLTYQGQSYSFRIYNCTTKKYLPFVKSLKVFPKFLLNKNIHITNLIREDSTMRSSHFLEASEIYIYGGNYCFITVAKFMTNIFPHIREELNTVVGTIDNCYYVCKTNSIYVVYSFYSQVVTFKYDIITKKLTQLKTNSIPKNAIIIYSKNS